MIKTFQSTGNRTITFEEDKVLSSGFIAARKWLNTVALSTGSFPEYVFNPDLVREATPEEISSYQALKDRSVYALNADQ